MRKNRLVSGSKILGWLRYFPLILWIMFWGVALLWIVLASVSTTREIFSNDLLGSGIHFENYINAWKHNNVSNYLINSIITSGVSCALIVLISAPAAYVLSKKTFLGKKLTLNSFVIGMSIPQVMLIIPIYIWFVKTEMLGHFSAGFTLDTYAHVTTSAQKEAAQTMGNILSM